MLDLYEELKAIISALDENGIDYALCSGLAMAMKPVIVPERDGAESDAAAGPKTNVEKPEQGNLSNQRS